MVAMVFSPAVHRVAPIAASMAIVRPEAIDDALALASRSAAEDGGCRPFCFAMQSALARGGKWFADAVAA